MKNKPVDSFASEKNSYRNAGNTRRRPKRVAEILREEISQILLTKFRDPRLDGKYVTITEVDVSPDLKNAKVYYSTMKADINQEEMHKVLIKAATFFRAKLSGRLEGGYGVPVLKFIRDEVIDKSMEMDDLIDAAIKKAVP